MKPGQESAALLACIEACRAIIAAFASGQATPVIPRRSHIAELRYAPSAVRGLPPDSGGVPYTLSAICAFLKDVEGKDVRRRLGTSGRMAPSQWMRCAINLLEGFEEGWLDEKSTLTFIHDGFPGFGMRALVKSLPARRQTYLLMQSPRF